MFGAALTVFGVTFFMWLGFWQLSRADQKQALLDRYATGQQTQVEITPQNAASLQRYQRVQVSGRFDPTHQILLDNMPSHAGQPGYRVLTPFETAAGWLLVDRGWIALGSTRSELPDITVGNDPRTLTGTIDDLPRAGIELKSPPVDANAPWPRTLSFPQQPALEQQLGRKLVSGLLLLDASQPDGYERTWEAHLGFRPERHIGYAVQWFAFAIAAVILFVITGFRTKKATDESTR